jgi:hypothetical protein
MHQWVTRRSLMLHVAFLVVAGGCLLAGWWQVHRAMQGNTLSYLYSIEWPAFAVVAGIGWWQMFHDTPEDIAARKAHHARMREASRQVVARTLPRSALAITVGSADVDGRMLPEGERGAIGAGEADLGPDLVPVWAGHLTRRDDDVGEDAILLGNEDDPADDLGAYNRYLALLAVRGKTKTWRNPHGV